MQMKKGAGANEFLYPIMKHYMWQMKKLLPLTDNHVYMCNACTIVHTLRTDAHTDMHACMNDRTPAHDWNSHVCMIDTHAHAQIDIYMAGAACDRSNTRTHEHLRAQCPSSWTRSPSSAVCSGTSTGVQRRLRPRHLLRPHGPRLCLGPCPA